MASGHKTEVKLPPELEAIATAACEQLRAKTDGDPQPEERLQRGVGDAAGRDRRWAERTYEQAVGRAARLGLVRRDTPRRHMSRTARSGRCSRVHSPPWQIAPPRR